MNCDRIGCKHRATKWPVITFASKQDPTGPRAEFRFPLAVCDKHAAPDIAMYVSDQGWAQIAETFGQRGLGEPDRSTLRVEFVPCQ